MPRQWPIPFVSQMARPWVPWFIRWRISANAVTILSLVAGVVGGLLFLQGTFPMVVGGAVGFLVANVLDECDGKVARATGTSSPRGAFLDTVADCVVHVALFVGLGIGMNRQFQNSPWLFLGLVAAGGSFLSLILDVSGITPWQPHAPSGKSDPDSLSWLMEWARIDFSLLVVLSAIVGRVGWLLWAGALGVFLFWIPSTFLMAGRARKGSEADR